MDCTICAFQTSHRWSASARGGGLGRWFLRLAEQAEVVARSAFAAGAPRAHGGTREHAHEARGYQDDRVTPPPRSGAEPPSRRDNWTGATPGRRGRVCENTLGPVPHQALRAGGRSRHGRCRQCGTDRLVSVMQDVAASADTRRWRCASPKGRSAHRTPVSFAQSGTALSHTQTVGWPALARWLVQRAAPATNRSLIAGPQRRARHRRARRCLAPTV